MPMIVLQPGDKLTIRFSDTTERIDCDGCFEVHFDSKEHPDALVIKETEGLPGSEVGAANAILYHEKFGTVDQPDEAVTERAIPTRYKVKALYINDMGSISEFHVWDSIHKSREEDALWHLNRMRDHDGLKHITELPDDIEFVEDPDVC